MRDYSGFLHRRSIRLSISPFWNPMAAAAGDYLFVALILVSAFSGVLSANSQIKFGNDFPFKPSSIGSKGGTGFYKMCRHCVNYVFYEGWQMSRGVVTWQLISDLVVTIACFYMPYQLYTLVKKSKSFPYKPLIIQFGAFFAMLGLSHFLTLWSYGSLPRLLLLLITTAKLLTAFVSCTAAITLVGVLPDILGLHRRTVKLKEKVADVDKEVIHMLTRLDTLKRTQAISAAIRQTLDRRSICSTACLELQKFLRLDHVALWLPAPAGEGLELAYGSTAMGTGGGAGLVPFGDETVQEIVASGIAKTIPESCLIAELSRGARGGSFQVASGAGRVAAVPVPLLQVTDFEARHVAEVTSSGRVGFGVLLLALPGRTGRKWRKELLEVAESVADQLVIALSHTAVLEDSQRLRDQLVDQENNLRMAELEGHSAVRARDNFLTVMKHEMRTPMHSITALSSLLAEADLEEEQRSMVETVARSSTLLSTLVSDILDFWRLEDDSVGVRMEPFELASLAKEAETLVAPIAKDKGLKFAVKLESNLPVKVNGDSNRLLQVLLNVTGNAIKATDKDGSVTLTVAMEKMESARDGFVLKAETGFVFVRFEVRDTGSELLEADIPRLFEKFQDSDGKMSRTGLGLALSRKFVQLHDGHIWIESGGKGGGATSRFIVKLKLEEDGGKEEEEEDEWEVPVVNFYALRIMVVDDNMINRLVTRRLLESIGSQTKVVDSGKECLRLLKERSPDEDPYDVLLLDLMMPEMDGYTTADKILEEVPEKDRPIIVALTANADESTQEKCMDHGMVGMITKPISLNPLRDILGKMLDNNAKK